MRKTTFLATDELDALERLGSAIRLARLRRGLTQTDFGLRMGVARGSVVALENGRPGVAVGILARALAVLGYPERLGALLEPDPHGDELDAARRSRAGSRPHVADF